MSNNISFTVSIEPFSAADIVEERVVKGSFSAELIERYESINDSSKMVVMVFEKYYMRNSSRASLTVVFDNLSGVTKVNAIGSGGGQGVFFKFDWGAGDSFVGEVERALEEYRK